jgi:hypothetical protein
MKFEYPYIIYNIISIHFHLVYLGNIQKEEKLLMRFLIL